MRRTVTTQAEHNAMMARLVPELFRPATAQDAEIAARPIRGMLFAVDQHVRDKRTGRTGTIDYCTAHTNGSRKYVITWDDGGQRTWIWEVDLRAERTAKDEPPQSVISSEAMREGR